MSQISAALILSFIPLKEIRKNNPPLISEGFSEIGPFRRDHQIHRNVILSHRNLLNDLLLKCHADGQLLAEAGKITVIVTGTIGMSSCPIGTSSTICSLNAMPMVLLAEAGKITVIVTGTIANPSKLCIKRKTGNENHAILCGIQ